MVKRIILAALCSVFIIACGGGGGSSSGGSNSIYSGTTTQATIDSSNASNLTTDSYKSLGSIDSSSDSASSSLKPGIGIPAPLAAPLAKVAEVMAGGPRFATATSPGNCGGTLTIDSTGSTGAKTVTMAYSNYCLSLFGVSFTTNGTVVATGASTAYTVTFTSYSVTLSGTTVALSGTVGVSGSVTGTVTTATSTVNLEMSSSGTGGSYSVKMENVAIAATVDSSTSGYTSSISGKFYYSTAGYVTLSTPTTISGTGTSKPSAGELRADGAANTAARITFTSSTTYTVEYSVNNGTTWITVTNGTW